MMDRNDFDRLVRRAFSTGVTGKEELDLELEAGADDRARRMLEQAETDDRAMFRLRAALEEARPWYRSTPLAMAASALAAAGLTLLVTRVPVEPGMGGVASSSVYYLETTRSASVENLPVVTLDVEQHWVTLVLYPAYEDFSRLMVEVQRLDEAQPADTSAGDWSTVWSTRANAGNREALMVALERSLLDPGIHQVSVNGVPPGNGAPVHLTSMRFRVVRASE